MVKKTKLFASPKFNCAVPENIHTPPTEWIGISWGMGGSGRSKNIIKEICEALLEFPEGWEGVRKYPFRGGGMDIFWNYTLDASEAALGPLCRLAEIWQSAKNWRVFETGDHTSFTFTW